MAEEPKNRRRTGRTSWLKIAGAVPLSFDVRKIVLGTVALILIQAGWSALDRLAPGSGTVTSNLLDLDDGFGVGAGFGRPLGSTFISLLGRVAEPSRVLIGPMLQVFLVDRGIIEAGRAALHLLWAIAVLGIVGGAISRSAVAELGGKGRTTLVGSLRFALRSARPLIAAPLFPIAVAAFCGLGCVLIGPLYRIPAVGGVLAAVTLFIPLALGLVMALLLIDLAAAWPFIHVSVAADAESTLDAMTRAFGYVNRRPAQFVACVAIVWLMGTVGLFAVDLIAGASLNLAAWGLSFTAPETIVAGLGRPVLDASSADSLAATAPFLWAKIARLLAHGWIYGYYWSAAAVVYLALRRNVDGAPFSEIKDETDAIL